MLKSFKDKTVDNKKTQHRQFYNKPIHIKDHNVVANSHNFMVFVIPILCGCSSGCENE